MLLRIRPPVAGDAGRLAQLSTQLGYPVEYADLLPRIERLAQAPGHLIRIAESEHGAILGWIHAAEQDLLESGRRCEILGLIVDPEHRRQGVGRELVGVVETWARERGLTSLSVRTNVTRAEAPAFYGALGFHQAKTQAVFRRQLA